ncbi:protein IN2-1-like protein B-like [Senna tora]|uniref:Protein IN2-1-like protein B-like n=1 Tax=Senna tora TaxID=362788 RepID=A0A834SXJ1_9FABA|nr:protein IN2-1-like protein B-like [Senna tora]
MAVLLPLSSSPLTSIPDLSLPPSLPPSASGAVAIKFSRSHLRFPLKLPNVTSKSSGLTTTRPRAMATGVQEVLPPPLTSTSAPPSLFDGTTRQSHSEKSLSLFFFRCVDKGCISPTLARMHSVPGSHVTGLQDKIQLVPIDLQDRPAWYKEKVYPPNKVPSLEHNNEVRGESLDLMKYIDSNFEGPSLLPDDPAKREFAEELLSYTDTFYSAVSSSFKDLNVTEAGSAFDYIETALSKYDGAFFLGQFSLVDIAYAPFIERFRPFLMDVKNYDIAAGRPKLAAWIESFNPSTFHMIPGVFGWVPLEGNSMFVLNR